MLTALDISQLIAYDLGSVDFCVNICMRVTIYPHINPAVRDIVMQIHYKSNFAGYLFMPYFKIYLIYNIIVCSNKYRKVPARNIVHI